MPIFTPAFLAFLILVFSGHDAMAQNNTLSIPSESIFDISSPPQPQAGIETPSYETHPMLRMTPEKSELIRLSEDAVSVVVGNPAHLSVLLDTPRVVVLIPRAPGATHFSVLNREGEAIMQRHVIVASPKQQYVRVRRSCANAGDGEGCAATSVYFCPDMCHEINVVQLDDDTAASGGGESPEETPIGPSGASSAAQPLP